MEPGEPSKAIDLTAEDGAAPSSSSGVPAAYPAPPIAAPTAVDLAVTEGRKKCVRALDAKICEQDEPTALAAIETALKVIFAGCAS